MIGKQILALAVYAVLTPLGAQDTVKIKAQTDSIRKETCRNGKLSASGLTCSGSTASPRVTVIRRLANRVDSLVRLAPVVVQPPPPPADTQPTPIPVPPPPTGSPAELPRMVPAFRDPYPGRLCSVTVASGGDVDAALRVARGGQVVCLAAGATYSAALLPARASGDTGTIVVRTSGFAVPEGSRVTPAVTGLATIRTGNSECALRTTPGTHGWYLAGLRFTTTAPMTYNIVCLGIRGPEQTTLASVPQRLILSRVIVDGGAAQIQNCLTLNSGATAIVDSWLMNCHGKGIESHGIASYDGPGPHLVQNNYIDGSGINLLWGGATPGIANMRASDITVRRNHLTKPLAWKGDWTAKNLLETKNVNRILVEENVLENSWTDAQTGIGVLFKSANDQGTCNWCQTTDVTYRRNLLKGAETGLAINAAENYCKGAPDTEVGPNKWCQAHGEIPPATARVSIYDNVFEDLGSTGSGAKGVYIAPVHSAVGVTDLVLERNVTAQAAGKSVSHGMMILAPGVVRGVFRDNVLSHGYFAVISNIGDNSKFGDEARTLGAPNALWQGMTMVKLPGHDGGGVPSGTAVVSAETALASTIRATVNAAVAGVVIP